MSSALSLDTMKLVWGITPTKRADSLEEKKEIKSADQILSSLTNNQLNKRRSSNQKKRR